MNAATQRPGTDLGVSYATVFRIHGTEKYKSIATRCQQTEPILPRQQILLTVKRFLSKQIFATEYTTVREGVLYPVRKICLKGTDLDSQKSVTNSQPVNKSQSVS
jgi:hypothetical protein